MIKIYYIFAIKNVKKIYTIKIFFPFAVFLRYYRNEKFPVQNLLRFLSATAQGYFRFFIGLLHAEEAKALAHARADAKGSGGQMKRGKSHEQAKTSASFHDEDMSRAADCLHAWRLWIAWPADRRGAAV